MDVAEKRNFINNNLSLVNEPAIDELYTKMVTFLNEAMVEESEVDISNGNVITHESLKKEIFNWRPAK